MAAIWKNNGVNIAAANAQNVTKWRMNLK